MTFPKEKVGALLELAARCLLGGLLCYAGGVKWLDPAAFADEISNYRLLPEFAPYLAMLIPPLELVLGVVLLLAPRQSRWLPAAALGAGLLLVVFTVGVLQVLYRGIDISCGCFGGASSKVTAFTALRNLLLLTAAGLICRWSLKRQAAS